MRFRISALNFSARLLAFDDSFGGATRCAGTAADAGVRIDVVDFAFADSANGAFGEASAASNALVGNNVSHCE